MKWITAAFPRLKINGVGQFIDGALRSDDPVIVARMEPWVGKYGIEQVADDVPAPPTYPDPFKQYLLPAELPAAMAAVAQGDNAFTATQRAAFVPRDEYVPGDGDDTADLGGTPLELRATAGTYPARPATTRPVHFIGPTAPAGDGSTAGGGGMVPGLDAWFWWAPQ